MLKEALHTAGANRRWFNDDYFDLIVWYGENSRISGFQLCYDRLGHEHALTWREHEGLSHHRIDSGESSPFKNMAPVLLPDGAIPYESVLEKFQERAANIDETVVRLVLEKLQDPSRGLP